MWVEMNSFLWAGPQVSLYFPKPSDFLRPIAIFLKKFLTPCSQPPSNHPPPTWQELEKRIEQKGRKEQCLQTAMLCNNSEQGGRFISIDRNASIIDQ